MREKGLKKMNGDMLRSEIEQAYRGSGNTMGWRLLTSPESTLNGARIAFVGLNPGGSVADAKHSVFAVPEGQSAYVDESWAGYDPGQSPLQRQMRALFARLNVVPSEVLAGNLVPFRSPDWSSLRDSKGSLAFGKSLWKRILLQTSPSLVLTMGGETTKTISDVLGVASSIRYPVGWGKITAVRGEFEGGTLIGLPHLSRFGVMNRSASADFLNNLFKGL